VSARTSSASMPRRKDEVQARLAAAWARTIARMNGRKNTFADAIGCCPDTVSNALSGNTVPELHTALNSLLADPNALDEVLSLYGFILVPNDMEMSPDMQTLAQMGKAMAEFLDALRDGKRTHRETLELAEELRPLIPRLTQIVHEAEGLKA
jgi:hypothetical protein